MDRTEDDRLDHEERSLATGDGDGCGFCVAVAAFGYYWCTAMAYVLCCGWW